MTGVEMLLAALVPSAALGGAWLTRRSGREQNQTSGWTALTAAHQTEITRLGDEVREMRDEIGKVRKAVEHEREQRRSLAEVLRSAWGHILRLGEQVRELGGHPEEPPHALAAWMERDSGLVVDQVTVSRTVVTDSRDPSPPLEHVEIHEPEDTCPRDL